MSQVSKNILEFFSFGHGTLFWDTLGHPVDGLLKEGGN